MSGLKFAFYKLLLSLLTSGVLAWLASELFDADILIAFLLLAIGLPLTVWLEKVKNLPAYYLTAKLMHRTAVDSFKERFPFLTIESDDEWEEIQDFFHDDDAIEAYIKSHPKAFVSCLKYEIIGLRNCGRFAEFVNACVVRNTAMNELDSERLTQRNIEL